MIKDKSCKAVDVIKESGKCRIVGFDIFTEEKHETGPLPADSTVATPIVSTFKWECLDVTDDGFVSLMTHDGDTREDIKLDDAAEDVKDNVRRLFEGGNSFGLVVLYACGREKIVGTFESP